MKKKSFLIFLFIIFAINLSYASSPKLLLNKNYTYTLLKYLKNAKKEVYINAYMWCCEPKKYRSFPCKILNKVLDLVEKGVKVVVILEKDIRSDSICNYVTSEIFKANLLTKYKNLQVYFDSPLVRSHEKVILIDRKYVFIGSHNLTQSALKYNNEVSVLINSPEIYQKLKKYLENIIKHSERIY